MNDGANSDDRQGTIRDRAYAIWQEEGHPEGRDADHWHRAESELATPDAVEGADPTVGVDATGLPTEDSTASAPPASSEAADAGPLTKIKKKTAKIAKSL